jgi:radical SAM/Cys-rich protein
MQNKQLLQLNGIPAFTGKEECKRFCMTHKKLDIMQVNMGRKCNLFCKHCHIEAGFDRPEVMNRAVMEACLQVFEKNHFTILDITGGAPEMNPDFQWFVEEAARRKIHTIVRTNLVILEEEGYRHLPELYARLKIEVVASLPYYTEKDTDRQRGKGVFSSCISMLQQLNRLGYGATPDLMLNLVYNPGGAFLPPDQISLTVDFKRKLYDLYGISFNNLYTLTNNPIGRFSEFLQRSGNMTAYLNRLVAAYNPATVENMMCRNQLSVGWDGLLYDCDFNQALGLTINGINHIQDLIDKPLTARKIVFGNHCYACTAGAGSSCGGAIA